MNRTAESIIKVASSDPLPRAQVHGRRWATVGSRLRVEAFRAAAVFEVMVLWFVLGSYLCSVLVKLFVCVVVLVTCFFAGALLAESKGCHVGF